MGVIDDDAIGVHMGDFGTDEFDVCDDLFWKSKRKERLATR